MNIIVDCKEKSKFIETLKPHFKFTIESLDLADIIFKYKDNIVLYIERKTINDLAASLNDGRYHEQKARLKGKNVIYLIEGDYDKDLDKQYNKTFNEEKFKGCIINTMVRDHLHIYFTENMEESALFIKDISKRLPRYANQLINEVDNEFNNLNKEDVQYTNALKTKKKENVTPKVCFINQLRQITGVSTLMAQIIVDKYLSMSNLIFEYEKCDGDKEMMLKEIKVNNRKVGPVVSKRIYEYLFNL